MAGPDDGRGESEEFGLTEQPATDTTRNRASEPAEHGHGHDHDHGHDHENVVFSLFRRTPDGGIVKIPTQDIERDISGYDERATTGGKGPNGPPRPSTTSARAPTTDGSATDTSSRVLKL